METFALQGLILKLTKLAPSKEKEIKRFLDGADSIQMLFGSESLCG